MSQIKLREIQHFLYCPHRWGLMEIDQSWAENYFVVRGNLLHQRVHDPERAYALRGKKVWTAVSVCNDLPEYDIFGVVDCLEGTPKQNGVRMDDGKVYALSIVEYKPTQPKQAQFHPEDAMQVFAQKLCVDSMFGCSCRSVIYYADTKKRVELPFDEQYAEWDEKLRKVLQQMRAYQTRGEIPQRPHGQKCSGCSMRDICLPKGKSSANTRQSIAQMLTEE